MSSRRRLHGAWGSFLAALVCAVCLFFLSGRRADHVFLGDAPESPPPRGDFSLGPLRWDLAVYAADVHLEPLRQFFSETCPGLKGLEAAKCISNALVRAFPEGATASDLFDVDYDPVADLTTHLSGKPGHCVTRSGLVAAIMLSTGLPARQVQIAPPLPFAHNADEIYDERWGWVLFDPKYGTVFQTANGPASASSAVVRREQGTAVRIAAASALPTNMNIDGEHELRYPDPWLYTRVGRRAASWPFRNLFVHMGTPTWGNGMAQQWLRRLGVFFAFVALAGWLSRLRLRVSKTRDRQPSGSG